MIVTTEQAVIGALLVDGRMLRDVTSECMPSDFEDQRLGAILTGMTLMFSERIPIDLITVSERLSSWEIRGLDTSDLAVWMSEVITTANVGFYAMQVHETATRRHLRAIGAKIAQEAGEQAPGVALANGLHALEDLRSGAVRSRVHAKTLGEILVDDQNDDEYEWVIDDLVEVKDRLLLTGVEGGGKSMMVRQMAILSAAGLHPFEFTPIKPARVLVVDAENTEKQWRRVTRPLVRKAAIRGSVNPAESLRLWCAPRLDLTKDSDLGDVHRLIDEHQPNLLCIGPLYRLIPRAINNDDDATPLLAALDTLRDRGVALVIEAHAGHAVGAGNERDLRPRGSAALLGWPEFGLGLAKSKDKTADAADFKLVRWRGDRDQRDWPTRISRGGEWPWTVTREPTFFNNYQR